MLFDMRRFLSAGVSPSVRELSVSLSEHDFSGAKIAQPVPVRFTAIRGDGEIELQLSAKAAVSGFCARCLDPVTTEEEINVSYTVKPADLEDEDFELPCTEPGILNVDEWVFQEFLFQVPTVLLCSENCSGLCPVCGNKRQACTCSAAAESTPVDARLSILKSLLN